MLADLHLPIKPRSDLALINGLIHFVIEHDLVDRDYIDASHHRLRGAARVGARTTRRSGSRRSPGSRAELICRTAWTYARARAAFIGWTMGVNHSTKGTETVNAINNLALITGNIGRAGAAPFSITGQCNAMGTREAGFASCLPGYRKFENAADRARARAALGRAGGADSRLRAGWPIPTSSRRRSIAAFARSGSSPPIPIVSFPNLGALQQALEGARLPGRAGRLSPDARRPSTRTWCCLRRCGARRRGPTPTPSGA